MRWIRSTWGMRSISAVLLVCMLPTFTMPMSWASRYQQVSTYGDWLLGQLGDPDDATAQAAIQLATETASSSLRHFLQTFLDALPADSPHRSWVLGAETPVSSDQIIVDLLELRYLRLIGDAILPATTLVKAALLSATASSDRSVASFHAWVRHATPRLFMLVVSSAPEAAEHTVWPLHFRSQAQPMGP